MCKNYWKKYLTIFLIGAHLFLILSCDKNPSDSDKKEPPTLPPAATMQVDLSAFNTNQGSQLAKTSLSQNHFGWAALTVFVVNVWVVAHLLIPVGIFAQAASEKPVLENDGKFHWKYTSTFSLARYSTDLVGWIDTETKESVWEMYVTAGQLNHFKWYGGRAKLDLTEGYWIFYDASETNTSVPMVRIDWTYQDENHRSLTFTNILEGDENKDDVLKYAVEGTALSIEFTNADVETTSKISWDAITTAGCIEAPDYNEGQAGCWDEDHNDL